jgi:hypothetical protein
LVSVTSIDSTWEKVRYQDTGTGPMRFCRVVVKP